jgi:YidC/Oxa1 family membrane protein insertase
LNKPVQVNGLLGTGLVKRYAAQKALKRGLIGIRSYSTPAPVEEAAKPVVDSFVKSAVTESAPVVEVSSWLGVNEGFARLMDPVSWAGVTDPIFWFIQGNIELVHALSGLPWWSSLIACSVAVRVLTFPLQIQQTKQQAIMQSIQPELAAIRAKYTYASPTSGKKSGGSATEQATAPQQMALESREAMRKAGTGVFKSMQFTLPQAAVMISSFFVMRSIASDTNAYLHSIWLNGGAFWFENLTLADPTMILPLFSSLSTASLIAITPLPQYSRKTVWGICAFLCGLSFYFTYAFPVAIHMFWAGSSVSTLITTALLRKDAVRKFFGVPPLDPVAAAASAPKPLLYDSPPSMRPKVERVAVQPQTTATSTTTSMKKKTRK